MPNVVGSHTTYYGPGTSYRKAGSVSNESVTLLWKESTFYYIEYNVGSTGKKKRAYVATTAIPTPGTIPATGWSTMGVRYINTLTDICTAPAATSSTVNTNGESVNKIVRGAKVAFLDSYKPNSWALVEFEYECKKMRAYVWANHLSTSTVAQTVNDVQIFARNSFIYAGLPMAGYKVTQGFNDNVGGTYRGHLGYDLTDPSGGNVVRPLYDGEISSVRTSYTSNDGIGLSIAVKHTVNGETFYTTYHHLKSISVSSGKVTADTQIGVIGNTGCPDVHLHVCAYINSATTSPYGYCDSAKLTKCEDKSTVATYKNSASYKNYFYGATGTTAETAYPRCGSKRFFNPMGVASTNAALITTYKSTATS